jgi:methionyl-tRNA formyltransferase
MVAQAKGVADQAACGSAKSQEEAMRIILIGQAAFGEKVLEGLLQRSHDIVGVFCPPTPLGKPNPLQYMAETRGIPVYQPKRFKGQEVYDLFVQLQPDLIVMAFVTEIVPQRILTLPRLGTIQYHPSLLPKHRGGSAINWAIIQGETETGLTIFWPDAGIDTGPILLQKRAPIALDDTTGSLYFDKLFPLGVEALVEAVELVKTGEAPRIPQDEILATAEPLCTEALSRIDWGRPMAEVYNLIRGTNPAPGAVTTWHGQKLKIFDAARLDQWPSVIPGSVVALRPDGLVVGCQDGGIHIKRVMLEGGAKIKALEFVAAQGVTVGDRLGN